MSHCYYHALSLVRRWGGKPEDYLALHEWFDQSKLIIADPRHRALRHHAEGIFQLQAAFGQVLTNSDGKVVPVRLVGELHVTEDLGRIPSGLGWSHPTGRLDPARQSHRRSGARCPILRKTDMANTYIKASFVVAITPGEADLLRKACDTAEQIADNTIDQNNRIERFADLGTAFAKAFPPTDDDPFSGFLEIFDDPQYPHIDCQIEITEREPGCHQATVFGDQLTVDVIAQLIFRVCKSALPTGFEYAIDCDRLRPGEFGGGYVVITETGIEHSGTSAMLDAALQRASDEGNDGFVLTIRDPQHGLSFWNNDTGFGRLATATVFSEEEAGRFDKPIADDEPEWMALPAPLRR